ncbi:hypothetical protein [Burkholderia gladioli]|uniref:hypothetical protein n=1 Tax=Burkholderia gladioli TaxID=28095 RepID=UPI0016415D72|nr:hypothetical protein [Burkholderia gladioli]
MSDISEAVTNRLTPISGPNARQATWLPSVLTGNQLNFTVKLTNRMAAVFVEKVDVFRKLDREWGKAGKSSYPGVFASHPYGAQIHYQSQMGMISDLTLIGNGIFLDYDASVILKDVGFGAIGSKKYDYVASLCYAFAFGEKIRPLSSGSKMDELVGFSLAYWRQHAASR